MLKQLPTCAFSASLLIFLVGVPCTSAAPVPKVADQKPFYPTAVGTKWVYRQEKREWMDEITAAEQRDAVTTLTVRRTEGKALSEDIFSVSADGVTWVTTDKFPIEARILKLPLATGDQWSVDPPVVRGIRNEPGEYTVGTAEDVTVPAGKFRAYPVQFVEAERNGKKPKESGTKNTHWYAPGVGLVKFRNEKPELIRELKSFTPGK
ncbi:TapB family protein [Limnoglobus roseus]|uniref:DUF3108 domain-containing protein n=1 Tax=Limnoglobus roseus TaxID=2598579 RepID=A0A5C1AJ01_9BACT|nr:hypothetical protein [Limnoglobus roseus]QEL18635.1 hypothetical protein PX52LOC_05668 [Limnoglobus roseus]